MHRTRDRPTILSTQQRKSELKADHTPEYEKKYQTDITDVSNIDNKTTQGNVIYTKMNNNYSRCLKHTGYFIIYDTITKCNNFTYLQQIIFIYVSYCS